MGLFDAFGYQGQRALVVGGASGMGAATVDVLRDAGAEITMMDRVEVSSPGVPFHPIDLADRASIEAAANVFSPRTRAGDHTPHLLSRLVTFKWPRHALDRIDAWRAVLNDRARRKQG